MLIISIAAYLLLNVAVGWWASRRVGSAEDFVLAGRKLPLGLATMVTFATWFGSETMMGAPGRFVEGGVLSVVEDPLGAGLCLVLVGVFFARTFYRWNVITFCDFFGRRFGKSAEYLSALLVIPSYFGWIAAQLVSLSIIGQTVFGLPPATGVWVGAGLVALYTLMGGMWSISITDFLHNILLIVGLGVLAGLLLERSGGLGAVAARTPEGFFRLTPERWTFSGTMHYLSAWMLIGLGSIPQQDVFQRVMAAKDARTAVRSSVLAGLLYWSVASLPLLIGLMAVQLQPELMASDRQLLIPHMVLEHAPLWVQILFFGALVSALLSTTSGAILAPAAVLGENLARPLFPGMSDARLLLVIRGAVVLVTACAVYMALGRRDVFGLVSESSAFSLVSLFVPMVAGLYWPRAGQAGCLAAMALGWLVWFSCKDAAAPAIPAVLLGFLASALAMLIGTWAWPHRPPQAFPEK